MKVHTVRVDGQLFILEPGQDVGALEADIVSAARDEAGFVRFQTVGRSTVSVLITPLVGVRISAVERDEAQVAEWQRNPPSMDFDDGFS